jgi:hypothetical protein
MPGSLIFLRKRGLHFCSLVELMVWLRLFKPSGDWTGLFPAA